MEAQATAYSFGANGAFKYLALLPQIINEPARVTSEDDGPTEFDAFEKLQAMDPTTVNGRFFGRCWIHTHPRWRAFMSSIDIYQLFLCQKFCGYSLGIVISPRGTGIKVLFVSLTRNGYEHLNELQQEAVTLGWDPRDYIISHIPGTLSVKYYYQIPFELSEEPCTVVDLRKEEKVLDTLRKFIESGEADTCWS